MCRLGDLHSSLSNKTAQKTLIPLLYTPRQETLPEPSSPQLSDCPVPSNSPSLAPSPKAKRLWQRAYFLLRTKRAVAKISEEVILYGTTELKEDTERSFYQFMYKNLQKVNTYRFLLKTEAKREIRKPLLIHPEGGFKKVWDIVMSLMLLYTGVFTPYLVAFVEVVFWDFWVVFDLCVNFLFCCDIGITFFSAYVNAEGEMEVKRVTIACNYLKGWFWVDVLASMPFSLIDYFSPDSQGPSGNYNRLVRVMRLPRLYKLLRLARMIKTAKVSNSDFVEKMQDYLNINSRLYKLLRFLLLVAACVHLMGCLWYFSSKIDAGSVDSWVIRYGFQDEDNFTLYLRSIYWAVETILTVGYGDIAARTMFEQLLAIVWMIFGVGFYSYTVGSLSSFLQSIDSRESVLLWKMVAVQEFAKQVGLRPELREQVRNAIRFHSWKTAMHWNNKHSLFSELPASLQYEVSTRMYGGVVTEMPFFAQRNKQFAVFFMPLLKPMKLMDAERLYREKDYADTVYFIAKGRLDLTIACSQTVYKSYLKRSYVGEIEVIFHIPRIDTVVSGGSSELLAVEKKNFWMALLEFPEDARELALIAAERYQRHLRVQAAALRFLKSKVAYSEELEERQNRPVSEMGPTKEQVLARLQGIENEVKWLKTAVLQVQSTLQELVRIRL